MGAIILPGFRDHRGRSAELLLTYMIKVIEYFDSLPMGTDCRGDTTMDGGCSIRSDNRTLYISVTQNKV